VFLPDNQHFLFYVQGGPDIGGIFLGSLDAGTPTRLTASDRAGTYLADGWLLWVRDGTLVAQRLDLGRSALTGATVQLVGSVGVGDGRGAVSVSSPGLVAYRSGAVSRRQLTWRDRTGSPRGTLGVPDETGLRLPSVSPDGSRVAVSRSYQGNEDVWLID